MNKVALITGSSKGIGKEIAICLARNNIDVVINYLKSEKDAIDLKEYIIKTYKVNCLAIKCDVSNEIDVDNMFNRIEKEMGGVDILVNNAGIDLSNMFSQKDAENFRKTLDVNLIGAFNTSKRAYKHMIDSKWGRVINISSTNGINTYYPMCLEYDASKAGLISLTHNLSIQFAPYATVNAIAPGLIGTENELEGYTKEFLEEETKKILVNRIGTASDVANLVEFLVSDKASFINNTVIRIDGGQYNS